METPFNDRGVSVTRNALSAAGQVFPLRDIQAVRVQTVPKNRVVPLAIAAAGLVTAIVGALYWWPVALVCGAMLVVVGYLSWSTQDILHRLIVTTAGGEREALSSVDRPFVERVAQAVRQMMPAAPPAAPH